MDDMEFAKELDAFLERTAAADTDGLLGELYPSFKQLTARIVEVHARRINREKPSVAKELSAAELRVELAREETELTNLALALERGDAAALSQVPSPRDRIEHLRRAVPEKRRKLATKEQADAEEAGAEVPDEGGRDRTRAAGDKPAGAQAGGRTSGRTGGTSRPHGGAGRGDRAGEA